MSGISVISAEMATKEVTAWLDFKKVKESTRVNYKDTISALSDALKDGYLILNEDKSFTQKLFFPIGNGGEVKELVFQPRVTVGALKLNTSGASTGDARIIGTIAALTGKPKNIIEAMDSEDYNTSGLIALFFL